MTGRTGDRRRLLPLGAELGGILALPPVLYLLLRVEPFFRQTGVDPFIYLGYAFDQRNLIDRYGLTYYSVRFALIEPIDLTTRLFGTVGGYFVLRYALALLAGGSIYAFFRRTHGRGTAALGLVLVLTSPVFLRALMTAYSDTVAVPYLIGALVLLLWTTTDHADQAGRTLRMAGTGLLLGLAVHANPFNVATGAILVFSFACTEVARRRRRLLVDLAWIALMIGVVTLLGVAYYGWRFGSPDIFRPSIDAADTYSGSAGDLFRSPDYGWLRYRFHLYVPPLVLACWFVLRARRLRTISRGEATAVLSLATTLVFFCYYEFVRRGTALEIYYYTSYLIGPVVITLTYTVAAALERHREHERLAAACAAVVVAVPVLRNVAWRGFELDLWPAVPILVLLCVATALAARGRTAVPGRATSVVASATLLTVCTALVLGAPRDPGGSAAEGFRADPRYDAAIGNADGSGLDWYRLTHDLVRQTPDLASSEGHVLFWFSDGSATISAIQSAFLWRQSALMSTGPGMPFLDDWRIARLQEQRARWLVTLGTSRAEVDAGVDALRARGVVIVATDDFVLRAGREVIHGTTVTLQPPPA